MGASANDTRAIIMPDYLFPFQAHSFPPSSDVMKAVLHVWGVKAETMNWRLFPQITGSLVTAGAVLHTSVDARKDDGRSYTIVNNPKRYLYIHSRAWSGRYAQYNRPRDRGSPVSPPCQALTREAPFLLGLDGGGYVRRQSSSASSSWSLPRKYDSLAGFPSSLSRPRAADAVVVIVVAVGLFRNIDPAGVAAVAVVVGVGDSDRPRLLPHVGLFSAEAFLGLGGNNWAGGRRRSTKSS